MTPSLVLTLVLSMVASASPKRQKQSDDAPLPYDDMVDEKGPQRQLPRRSQEAVDVPTETEVEKQDREVMLAGSDDRNIGIGAEVVIGANLADRSRGGGVEPFVMAGARVTWEWARTLLGDEFWRDVFFADLTWFGSSASNPSQFGGTKDVYTNVSYHHVTLAPGFALPLWKSPLSLFAQVGGGFSFQGSTVYVLNEPTSISALRPILQYGGGLRFRIHLVSEEKYQEEGYKGIPVITFRLELTRFRRAYMDDTFVGGSLGIVF
jgi:hypothetical protein